jgi:hypothetical protein
MIRAQKRKDIDLILEFLKLTIKNLHLDIAIIMAKIKNGLNIKG